MIDFFHSLVDKFLGILTKTPLNTDVDACPDGLRIHISDIYREELGKIGAEQVWQLHAKIPRGHSNITVYTCVTKIPPKKP